MLQRLTVLFVVLLAACSEPPPPRSVQEFVENPILLEAAMVRCGGENRSETRYQAECVNAREAVKINAAKVEEERQREFEAQSELKRRALRRTQEAAAAARKRAEEQRKLREEAEYLAQFGELPPDSTSTQDDEGEEGNAPMMVLPEAENNSTKLTPDPGYQDASDEPPKTNVVGSNAPGMTTAPEEPEPPASDLETVREELQRRNEQPEG